MYNTAPLPKSLEPSIQGLVGNAERRPAMASALGRLGINLESAMKELDRLQQRLSPVLLPTVEPSQDPLNTPKPALPELVQAIENQADFANRLTQRINSLIQSLEI